jgi:hypothetical protein
LFAEMKAAFGWCVELYTFYGGYPGAVPLIDDHTSWARYIIDSLGVARAVQASRKSSTSIPVSRRIARSVPSAMSPE